MQNNQEMECMAIPDVQCKRTPDMHCMATPEMQCMATPDVQCMVTAKICKPKPSRKFGWKSDHGIGTKPNFQADN